MVGETLCLAGTDLPDPVEALLRDRDRQFDVRKHVPEAMDELRGLIIGPALDTEEAPALAGRAIAADVPVLWYGPSAASRLQGDPPTRHAPLLTEIVMTPAGFDDTVTAATMPGALFPVSSSPITSSPAGLVPLWLDAQEGVLLAREGSALVTACDLDAPEMGEDSDALRPFVVAQVAALVGRWVDLAVGRTDDEKPWGRRGPTPIPAPGLSLHPA